ncbi:hypothetical protein [Bacillus sp. FJAT-29814]|uniref:hypothetical protein n=1 Tax=Bacillus sp. FJAT-29814 TaxID=1729688 RepID=UPI0012E3B255|nr:hypothetical protein [Bacillus sp. FJAT-29814]
MLIRFPRCHWWPVRDGYGPRTGGHVPPVCELGMMTRLSTGQHDQPVVDCTS